MLKILLIVVGLVVVVLVAGALWFWSQMGKPLYEPGRLRERGDLDPPAQPEGATAWLVEPCMDLAHSQVGSGPTVLVVHGGPGQPFDEPIAALAALTDRYRFVYYDQRGCGASTRPVDAFTGRNFYANMLELDAALGLAAQIADIERIRRILGDDRFIILGHSFGAFLAAMYAAEFPDRVDRLVLVAPADVLVFPAPGGGIFDSIESALPADRLGEFAAFQREYLDFGAVFTKREADLQQLNRRFAGYYLEAAGLPPLEDDAAAPGWMVQAMYLSMGKRHDYRPALRSVKAPTLVMHGNLDLQPEAASAVYLEAIPNATMVGLPAGHMMFDDAPAQFAEAIGAFLEQ